MYLVALYVLTWRIRAGDRSGARTNTGVVGSSPTRGMNVCVLCFPV
jgi:hypothetical protein